MNDIIIQPSLYKLKQIKAIQDQNGHLFLKLLSNDQTSSSHKWSCVIQKQLQTLGHYISATKDDLKNPKTALKTTNHCLCKSIYGTIGSFKLEPGQISKNSQFTNFEFVQPKKNMSIMWLINSLTIFVFFQPPLAKQAPCHDNLFY